MLRQQDIRTMLKAIRSWTPHTLDLTATSILKIARMQDLEAKVARQIESRSRGDEEQGRFTMLQVRDELVKPYQELHPCQQP